MPLTFKQLSKTNALRCEESFHPVIDWNPSEYGNALAGETGESCNFIKKLKRHDDKFKKVSPTKKDHKKREKLVKNIGKELADVVCYVDLLATRLGIDLEKNVIEKFNEVSQRVKSKRTLK